MSDSLNDFTKLYLKSLAENSYHTLIKDGVNYELIFKEAKSVTSIYKLFYDGIKLANGYEIKLSNEDIIGFYLNNDHGNLAPEDIQLVASIIQNDNYDAIGEYLKRVKTKIQMMKAKTIKFGSTIKKYIETINSYRPLEYNVIDRNEVRNFKISMSSEDGGQGRDVTEEDALIIFNNLTCTTRYPCIVYCNPNKEKIARCGNGLTVKFSANRIEKLNLPSNSITVLNEIGYPITFNFESKTCSITTNPSKVNDDTLKKILAFMPMLNLDEESNSKKIIGKVSFNVDRVIDYFSLFHFFITDPIASVLFFVDETNNSWCSRDIFYVYFRDFSYEMIDGTEIKTSENYLRLLIPTTRTDNSSGFTISFSAKSSDMLPSFLYKFSRLLSNFTNSKVDNISSKFTSQGIKYKIYTKPIKALINKGGEFFKHDSKSRSETALVTSGHYYSRVCQAKDQPIIISEEEVPDWKRYGREPFEFPPKEWGFTNKILVVCPKELIPSVNLKPNDQDVTGRIKALPCCAEYGKFRGGDDVTAKNTNRKGTSEQINKLFAIGTLNDALASFLSISHNDDGTSIFSKQGTIIDDNLFIKNNSFIIAVLLSTGKSPIPGKHLSLSTVQEIEENINAVKNAMVQLPMDIYRQELYDMSDSQIIESIINVDTFIDPYLYYRGLEILFEIQIFTFTSDKGRKNPLSRDEDNLQIATLEVPRCKYTHIRYDNKKDIVCIYKNYGSQDKQNKIPACELIISSVKDNKTFNRKVNSGAVRFYKNLFTLMDRVCHSFEWERDNKVPIQYTCLEDPYSTINWGKHDFGELGDILGQEIDIYGKVYSFIFKEWVILVPPTQPLFISSETNFTYVDVKVGNKYFKTFSGGVKVRPPLKSFSAAHSKFETSGEDEDGVWIPFNGKQKGLKVLCKPKVNSSSKNYNIDERISTMNKTIILMTVINWLWRSDNYQNMFPDFETWWVEKSQIDNPIIFHSLPDPKINCHNIMLPKLDSYDERIQAMTKIWPFIFYRRKIHVSPDLFRRVLNFFKVEEIYSRDLLPDNPYWAPNQFIVGLIPTDEDFKRNSDIILTKSNHISDWISRNNSEIFKFKSLHNTNVISSNIIPSYKKFLEPYLFKDGDGKIYLIQNSSKKGRPLQEPALQIAQFWKTHERNPGHAYTRNDDKDFYKVIRYVEYQLGPNDTPEVSVDKSEGFTDYLQILAYEDGESFAAMLPIL